jgi:hypothetical protein
MLQVRAGGGEEKVLDAGFPAGQGDIDKEKVSGNFGRLVESSIRDQANGPHNHRHRCVDRLSDSYQVLEAA